ncbi:MAG: DNA methyltransferase, partial [Treponema sp.]|nr:DNA methyltransferase [Treponema sp.]
INWKRLLPEGPHYFFVEKDFSGKAEYENGFGMQELFPVNSLGLITKRDNLSISFNTDEQIEKLSYFLNDKNHLADVCEYFGIPIKDKDKWDASIARKNTSFDEIRKNIFDILYRPFDTRKIFYNEYFVARLNKKVLRHLQYANTAIIIGRQGQAVGNTGNWNIVYITNSLVDQNIFYRGGGTVFPLYLYPDENTLNHTEKRRPNLDPSIVQEIAQRTGLTFTEEKEDRENTFAPMDVLDYIYAVLYSTIYREKYREFLKIDFPRIPYPENAEHFQTLASYGSLLRSLHLMEKVSPARDTADFPVAGTNKIETLQYQGGRVYVNKRQYFEPIPPEIWGCSIGGYRPAEKWLKDRRGRVLSFEDIEHYQKIITVLKMTIPLQLQIDAVIA